MKKEHKKILKLVNNREVDRQKKSVLTNKMKFIPMSTSGVNNIINNIMHQVYTKVTTAITKYITNLEDRDKLLKEIEVIFKGK